MVYLLTSESLTNLIQEGKLNILKKSQKLGTNYFFTPTIGIKLYNPKVIFTDRKNITFQFDKRTNLNLYKMLEYINSILMKKYKNSSQTIPELNYNLFSENDDYFNIRVFLPYSKGKYDIQVLDNQSHAEFTPFRIPNKGAVYDIIVVEIRNIWEQPSRSGFNLELKSIEHV
jgi:hypothetical protein